MKPFKVVALLALITMNFCILKSIFFDFWKEFLKSLLQTPIPLNILLAAFCYSNLNFDQNIKFLGLDIIDEIADCTRLYRLYRTVNWIVPYLLFKRVVWDGICYFWEWIKKKILKKSTISRNIIVTSNDCIALKG